MTALSSTDWIGIDLGTFNSSAAIRMANGKIVLIKEAGNKKRRFLSRSEQHKEFPSFISFDDDGEIGAIGMAGKEKAHVEPERVVWGIKRLLGKTYTELKESGELERFPYLIRPNRKNGQCIVRMGEKNYTPEQLCTEIFKVIKAAAEHQVGKKLDSAVVSVPAYFDPLRVSPIIEAARNAGFLRTRTIPEPVAAALAHDIEITARPVKTVVFDLGAGTLDVTAGYLYRKPDDQGEFKFQVVKNTGDTRLGGMDMDDRLLRLIMDKCQLSDLSPTDTAVLRRSAELAKIQMSEESQINHSFTLGEKEYTCTLSQLDLKATLEGTPPEKNLLEECRRQVMAGLDESGWAPQDVECLLLIGGPTKLPCIQEVLQIVFHSNPNVLGQLEEFSAGKENVNRMTAVAEGAAISIDRKVDDKVPAGYGFEDLKISGEEMVHLPRILIPRDSGYPFKAPIHMIGWTNLQGLFEFKIIQRLPKSEVKQFGHEYKFVGIQKFAVKNPNHCMIGIQMGYNENKEFIVTIIDALSGESATYQGMVQSACIGMNYPLKVKRPPNFGSQEVRKIPPSPELVDRFVKWADVTTGYICRKLDNFPVPDMKLSQRIDELTQLLKKGDAKSRYETLYTQLHTFIWNANSHGVLSQSEYIELTNHLTEYEDDLFKIDIKKQVA